MPSCTDGVHHQKQEGLVSISSILGSEPAVVSFGSGRNPQQGNITVNLVDRFHRKQNIWQIESTMRKEFLDRRAEIGGRLRLRRNAMSSIRAAVDVMVTGPDPKVLSDIGQDVQQRLERRGPEVGLPLWGLDKKEVLFTADRERCASYGISPKDIAAQVQAALQGGVASDLPRGQRGRLSGPDPPWPRQYRDRIDKLAAIKVSTPSGPIPLASLGTITAAYVPALLTRQDMQNSIDIYGYKYRAALPRHGQRATGVEGDEAALRVTAFSRKGTPSRARPTSRP